jgi:hypothetical protein
MKKNEKKNKMRKIPKRKLKNEKKYLKVDRRWG